MIIDNLHKHVQEIAAELGCTLSVSFRFETSAMMYVEYEPPMVEVPPVTSHINYLINLHELGHVFHKHCQARPPFQHKRHYFDNGVLRSEAEAWNFAMDKSLVEIEPYMKMFIWNNCLGSYYQDSLNSKGRPTMLLNGNRHHVTFVYDKPDEYFSKTVARIQDGASHFSIEYRG